MWSLLSNDYSISGTFNKQILYMTFGIIFVIAIVTFFAMQEYGWIGAIGFIGYPIAFIFQRLGHRKQRNELFGPNQKWKDDPYTKDLRRKFGLDI